MDEPKTCVILQPSYLPWRGYFHQIWKADDFVFYDDVQYDHHGWRNRNRIKTADGPRWLTIPVRQQGARSAKRPIHTVEIANDHWGRKHWRAIEHAYSKAPFFDSYAAELRPIFESSHRLLADVTIQLTVILTQLLGIEGTCFHRSSGLQIRGGRSDRLASICKHFGARRYVSGPSARSYLDKDPFNDAGIEVEFIAYRYPNYPQQYGAFAADVSVLDLLFMTGPDAGHFIWSEELCHES